MSESSTASTVQTSAGVPAGAPRAVGSAARSHSWFESSPRFWLISAAIVLAAALGVIANQSAGWSKNRHMANNGIRLDVRAYDDTYLDGRNAQRSKALNFIWEYQGKTYRATRQLPNREGYVTTGTPLPVVLDPTDPNAWIEASELPSLGTQLFLGLVILPFPLLLLAVAWLQRKCVLSVWTDGQPLEAIVIETPQNAGLRTYLVKCTPRQASDKRLLKVRVDKRLGKPAKGDTLWLVEIPGRSIALHASTYQGA